MSFAATTPGNSAIGDTAAAGTSSSVARADHKHGREASGTAGASAVGDTASAGSATTVALSDHRHSREAFGTPVNIDASLTSLSAGSLTTVARADHVHTVSKVPVLLATTTLSSNSSAVNFNSFSSSYTAIEVRYLARSTYTGQIGDLWFRVNSLSTSIYYSSYSSALESKLIHIINAAGNFFGTYFSSGSLLLANYASSSNVKAVLSSAVYNNSTTAWSPGWWALKPEVINTTSAITSVNISASADNIALGSIFELWGWP